jgi:hypothetical protein
MNRVILCAFCISLCLIGTLAAPAPVPTEVHESHPPGAYVGVRAKVYEEKNPYVKLDKISIHPGVVMEGPDPETGKYPVAMISKKLPNDPPQENIKTFHPNSNIYGNIALHPPYNIKPEDMKPWKDDKTGVRHVPMEPPGLHSLKQAMGPHKHWRPPTPPPLPPPPPPGSHRPQPGKGTSRRRSRSPSGRHVNAHASSSRHPASGSSEYHYGTSSGSYRGGFHPAGGYGSTGGWSSRPGPTGYSSRPRSHTDSNGRRPSPPGSKSASHTYPAKRAGEKRSLQARWFNTH